MERKLKEIVVDKSSLSWLRDVDGLYVDKTKSLLKLICSGSYFLLSRPRRFGKSLTIDTLEQIFKGNKELFKGLYIYDKYDFKEYPEEWMDIAEAGVQEAIKNRPAEIGNTNESLKEYRDKMLIGLLKLHGKL